MKLLAIIAIVFFALMLLAKPLEDREKQKKDKLITEQFGDRQWLGPEGFYEAFFSSQGCSRDIVLGIREIMEKVLDADLSFLKDSDDFSKNLRFFWDFDSMANVELVQQIEQRFGIRISDQEAEATCTVRQLVDLVQAKVSSAHQKMS
jgi:acyl carrier protein